MDRRKHKSHLAVRPVEVPLTLRDYSGGSQIRGITCNGLHPMWMGEQEGSSGI
jgi:hypothetical protein